MDGEESRRLMQYVYGLKAGLPVLFGFVPVGIAYAVLASQAGFSPLETMLMSMTVFAGASQIMAVGMYAQGAGIAAIAITTFILNLRHLIMSTCVMNRMKGTPAPLRILASFFVTDESFAIFTTLAEKRCTIWFYLGMVTLTWSSWQLGGLIGIIASGILPAIVTASFGIALYAMFISLLMPNLRGNARLALLVVMTACMNTVLSSFMDSSWALIASTLACAFLGVFFVDTGDE